MSTEVGTAYVTLIPSARGFASRMQREIGGDIARAGDEGGDDYSRRFSDSASSGIRGRAKSIFSGLARAGAFAVAAAGAAVGKVLFDSIGEAREAAVVGARTENVIRRMGGAANVTAKQVANLAGSLSNKAGVDDEAIQSGQNLLLTFGNIRNEAGKGNDIFNQTSSLMVDMSRAMGQDMKSSAIQLGKALNDPIKGVSALSRVGVSFTAQQQEQIKALVESGDTLKAQKIILGEVQKQFGGAAAAMATPADRAKVAWGNFQEQIGTYLLPTVDRLLTAFADGLPKVIAGGQALATKVAPVIRTIADAVSGLFDGFRKSGDLGDTVSTVRGAFNDLRDIVSSGVEIMSALWNSGFGERFVSTITAAFRIIRDVIAGAIKVIRGILNVVMGLIQGDWSRVWTGLKQIVEGLWTALKSIVTNGARILWNTIKNAGAILKGVWNRIWSGLRSLAGIAWRGIVAFIRAQPRLIVAGLRALPGLVRGIITAAFNGIKSLASKAFDALVDYVRAVPSRLRALGGMFADVAHAIIGRFVDGLRGAAGLVSDVAGNVWHAVQGFINDAIDKINAGLEFTIGLPGPDVHVNPPNIPHLATGGRATAGTLAVIGEGKEPETVFPDSVLKGFLARMTDAATRNLGGGLAGRRLALVLADGTELDAYIDERITSAVDLADETRRAGG